MMPLFEKTNPSTAVPVVHAAGQAVLYSDAQTTDVFYCFFLCLVNR